jgi:hypothetical protein
MPFVELRLTPYLKAAMTDPVGALAEPVPRLWIPEKDPVIEFPAVKIDPPKFTGTFAILFILNN